MLIDALLSIAHHLSVYALVALLIAELVLLWQAPAPAVVRTLARIDLWFGVAAGVVLAAGTCRVLFGIKGTVFYTGNPVFWVKIGLFLLAAVLSIYPTIRFIGWSRQARREPAVLPSPTEFQRIRLVVGVEAGLVGLIPICAALMARGYGY